MPKKSYKELLIKHLKKVELNRYQADKGNEISGIQYQSGFEDIGLLETGVAAETLKRILCTSDVCSTIRDMMKKLSFEFIHHLRVAIEQTPRGYITPDHFQNRGLPRKIGCVIKEWRILNESS